MEGFLLTIALVRWAQNYCIVLRHIVLFRIKQYPIKYLFVSVI